MENVIQWLIVIVIVLLVKISYHYYPAINKLYTDGIISKKKRIWIMIISFIIPFVGLAIISFHNFKAGRQRA